MHLTRRCPRLGIKNILIIILVVLEIATLIVFHNIYNQITNVNNTLEVTINNQATTIKNLGAKNSDLSNEVLHLEKEKSLLVEEKNQLIEHNIQLEEEIKALSNKITAQTNNKDFKSYMDYTTITDQSSKQWKLQQQAITNEDGLRCIDGRPLVAVGTGWGLSVGDCAIVYCDNGNSFEVIVGDIKADVDTMADNKTTTLNKCRCEFIVETSRLNQTVRVCGNVALLYQYSGYVTNITTTK